MNMNCLGTVRIISLQFSFSNSSVVPKTLLTLPKETPKESAERKLRANGVVFIEPTEKCDLSKVPQDLLEQNYILIDAFCQERINPKAPKNSYYMVRFLFIHKDFFITEKGSEEFALKRNEILKEFEFLCKSALWRVRGFNNPFFQDGVEIPNNRAVSMNMEALSLIHI